MKPAMNMKILIPEVDIAMTQGGLTTQDSSPNSVTSPRSTMQLLKMETANEWEWKVQTTNTYPHYILVILLYPIDYRLSSNYYHARSILFYRNL